MYAEKPSGVTDEVFNKIEYLASKEHKSMTNYIEYVLLKHISDTEKEIGKIEPNSEKE